MRNSSGRLAAIAATAALALTGALGVSTAAQASLSDVVYLEGSGASTGGHVYVGTTCTGGVVGRVSLHSFTPRADDARAGGDAVIVAATPAGEVELGRWTLPDAGALISTRDDLAPWVASVPAGPSLVLNYADAAVAHNETPYPLPTADSIAVWPQQARGTYAVTGGSLDWEVPADTARAWVQRDPSSPWLTSHPDTGAPDVWMMWWAEQAPPDTTAVTLRIERLDGGTDEATAPRPPFDTAACNLALQPHTLTVPVGQTASADLLAGAAIMPIASGRERIAAVVETDSDTMVRLGLTVDEAVVSVTPTEPGVTTMPYRGEVSGAVVPMVATSTLTVVATADAAATVDVVDQTVELVVDQEASIDLLADATATGVALDELVVSGSTANPNDLRDGTGWARTGRTATVLPTRPGTWTVEVTAATADFSAWDTATLTLVVTEAPVTSPTPEPQPGPAPKPEPTPEPEPEPEPPLPPVTRIETDVPLNDQPVGISGLGTMGLALTALAAGLLVAAHRAAPQED